MFSGQLMCGWLSPWLMLYIGRRRPSSRSAVGTVAVLFLLSKLRGTFASDAPPPNVLYMVPDQWNPSWDGLHAETATGPLPLLMPFLTRLAESGVRFEQAYVPSPTCGPSRACVASGKEYDATGVLKNGPWKVKFTTVYKILRDAAGYHTMTCGKDHLNENDPSFPVYHPQQSGWPYLDVGFSDAIRTKGKARTVKWGRTHHEPYSDFLNGLEVTMSNGTRISGMTAFAACMTGSKHMTGSRLDAGCDKDSFTAEVYPDDFTARSAIELLDRKPDGKPWLLQVNFPGPHEPIVSTAEMAESVRARKWPRPTNPMPLNS